MGLIHEIEEMQKKVANYDRLKEEHEKLKQQVKEAIRGLSSISTEIVVRRGKGKTRDLANYFYDKMKMEDCPITTKHIMEYDNNIDKSNASYILSLIKEQPNIEMRKDGRRIILYYRKREVSEEDKLKIGKLSFMG